MSSFSSLFTRRKNKNRGRTSEKEIYDQEGIPKHYDRKLDRNLCSIQELFKQTTDYEEIHIKVGDLKGCVCYLGTTLNKSELNMQVLEPLREAFREPKSEAYRDIDYLREAFFPAVSYEYAETLHQLVWQMLNGYAIVMIDEHNKALALSIGGTDKRSISEPSTQTIIRGPKEGFIEDINTNIGLIRKKIKSPRLVFEDFRVGSDSNTKLSIGYMKGIVNEDILSEVKLRINKINASGILDTGNVEEFITDETFTFFPLVYNSERPDSISGNILEGKIAILLDGSPFVLIVPSVFTDFFQSTEDYYQPFFMTSFIRIIRYVSFMITLTFPSLYVAITTYHHELMPTPLLINIQSQREGVPFPAVIEILMMELTFEVLREAGVRMPRAVGQTLSIVGALVIGQAAVEAGLVSNVLVVIVAFSAIASFVSPIYNFSIAARLIRFILIIMAASLGLYGILLSLIVMVIHLVSLRTFGIPYLTPVAPFKLKDQTDVFVRVPIWGDRYRPSYLMTKAPVKSKDSSRPSSPGQNTGGKKEND
ncbi:spore germination protein [Metabacillus halosaccharovorans]|uniref:spore germination protein n=1 Tax=Metabacillus halosaccharovorans TaxID=930124 RepID=UPI001C1FEC31|nr:spore germination protein [Metabacillus halosaccharovorans]MBU7594767.1 spore germination protein [Metabacillus halosaccharovorans]